MKKAQETMGREVFWQLPNDYRVMSEVRNNGVPLIEHAPKSPITQSIIELAAQFGGSEQLSDSDESGKSGMQRLLSLFGKK